MTKPVTQAATPSSVSDDLFVSDTVHEREIELSDGKKHQLFFKELPAVEFRRHAQAEQSQDENVRAAAVAGLIAASLVEPDGRPALTTARAAKLKAEPANKIFLAILEINGAIKPQGEGDSGGN